MYFNDVLDSLKPSSMLKYLMGRDDFYVTVSSFGAVQCKFLRLNKLLRNMSKASRLIYTHLFPFCFFFAACLTI